MTLNKKKKEKDVFNDMQVVIFANKTFVI